MVAGAFSDDGVAAVLETTNVPLLIMPVGHPVY
jgi:hypothetical protein